MADFETKLRWLSERGKPVGARKLIERIEADLAGDPLVVVGKPREGRVMTKTPLLATRQPRRNRGSALALATIVAVLAVGGLLYLALGGDDNQVADQTVDQTSVIFAEIAPGEMANLPRAPISGRGDPGAVWTGTELIVWGGRGQDNQTVDDGAAFNLANGTWRVIAPAPISPRQHPAAVWTGTEMIVWGGFIDGDVRIHDGAAYNPATDMWRPLPPTTFVGRGVAILSMVWTGDEAVVLGDGAAVAYDPVTDSWRRLTNPPSSTHRATWAGDSIVSLEAPENGLDFAQSSFMVRYDVAADSLSVVDIGSSLVVLVGVPGPDGLMSTFVGLPSETGAPTLLLDNTGNVIAELPAFPGGPDLFGDHVGASGLWVGDEAIFWIWNGEFPYPNEQVWALNPSTQTWRQLPGALLEHDALVVAGDVLLVWATTGGGTGGVAYRPLSG